MRALLLFLCLVCCGNALAAQSPQFGEPNPEDALQRLDAGKADPPDLESIATHQRKTAIPKLETMFDTTREPVLRGKVADTLIRLGATNPRYWDYLKGAAAEAVDSDAPWPVLFDAKGEETAQESPAFAPWARRHKVTPSALKEKEAFVWPEAVLALTETANQLAVPLLRRGLHSPNYLIQAECISGLATFNDRESIPEAIRVLAQAPMAFKRELAWALNSFNDPTAAAEAKKYLKTNVTVERSPDQVRR
jgi:hypothetical protein